MSDEKFVFIEKYKKECGGGGDCYFLSVAESLIQLKTYATHYDYFAKSQMNRYLDSLNKYVGGNTRKELSDKLRKDVVKKLLEKYRMGDKKFLNPVDNSEQQFYRYLPDDFVDGVKLVSSMDVDELENKPKLKKGIETYFINYFKNMARPGTWATSLEVMGTILLLRHNYNIMVGVTAAGTLANDPNSSERNVYGSAIIRIYNTTGYGSHGWHYQMLPFTSYDGKIICTDYDCKNKYPDCSNTESSVSNSNTNRVSTEDDNTIQHVMDQLIPEYITLIQEYTKVRDNLTNDGAEKKRLTSDIDLHLSYILHASTDNYVMVSQKTKDTINRFINNYFNNEEDKNKLKVKSEAYSETDAKITGKFIKILNKVNVSIKTKKPKRKKGKSYCCNKHSKGGGLKIKILKKPNKTKKISRKWSKKYKNSINCSEPRGFSQRQFCLSKTKKIREKK